jgi:class 3 adenylate cyclase
MLARRERPFRASSAIARYDGFVAKFMGDGILAYFGFPRAHEDNAERAVHAGLEIAEVVAGLETRAGTVELRIPKLRKGSEPSRAAAYKYTN